MKIDSLKQLTAWNLSWSASEPGPWELNVQGLQQALGSNQLAKGVYWISEPARTHATFRAKYCGKAVLQPLIVRLTQHVTGSHNPHIKSRLASGVKLRFRFVEFTNPELAEYVEGVMIAAFREEYRWNGRNEWLQHCVLETR